MSVARSVLEDIS